MDFSLFLNETNYKTKIFESGRERGIKQGENGAENNRGIKWQESDTHNINKATT